MVKSGDKVWYEILASKHFNNAFIGETPSLDPNKLVGRHLEVNYSVITNDPKRQNIKLGFVIDNVTENKANTNLIGYQLTSSYIKRLAKRSADKLEDSFLFTAKDGVKIRIKPSIYLKSKTKSSVLKLLRKTIKELIENFFKENDYDQVALSILNYELQRLIKDSLRKIHPVAGIEIRVFKKLQ